MLLIVLHHFSRHIGYEYTFDTAGVNAIWSGVAGLGGNLGVNIFLVITGYFSSKSDFSFKKLFRLLFQVMFWNVVCGGAACLLGECEFRIKMIPQFLCSFLFSGSEYWFFNVYILLFCCMPFLNGAISKVSKRQLLCLILFLWFLWSISPFSLRKIIKTSEFYPSKFTWFILMYFTGAYLRIYPPKILTVRKTIIPLLIFCQAVHILANIYIIANGTPGGIIGTAALFLATDHLEGFMPTVLAVLYFSLFLNLKIRPRKWILSTGLATFGVYLIHNNEQLKNFIWYKVFKITDFTGSRLFIPYSLLCTLIIFTVCALLETAREKFIENPLLNSKAAEKIFKKADSFLK